MYELGEGVSALANLAFGLVGVWMAHSLYRTTRKRWQAVAAWVLIFLVWSFGAALLAPLLPGVPYVRVSMLVGFTGIFVYLYLFQDIPLSQRVFTYFLVDTSQTLLVLLARTISTLCTQTFFWPGDVVFLCAYLPALTGFLLLFHFKLKGHILTALRAFGGQLKTLAAFAAVCYVTLLLQIDTWGPWEPLNVWTAGGRLGMIAFVLMGYVLAFCTLTVLLARDTDRAQARQLENQLALSERYYESLVGQVEEARVRDHDLRYHISILSNLCRDRAWPEMTQYLQDMSRELPATTSRQYTKHGAVNALLAYYAGLCEAEGIPFRCQAHLPELGRVEPLHLCVILGNALQNALEASGELIRQGGAPDVELKAVINQRQMAISISNRFTGQLSRDVSGNPVTSKTESGHGMGLASVRETVRRYGGWCGDHVEGDVFLLQIVLPMD